ncbi:hypothetical protein CsSME_00020509 [Camellia sinensis var. sinensis]
MISTVGTHPPLLPSTPLTLTTIILYHLQHLKSLVKIDIKDNRLVMEEDYGGHDGFIYIYIYVNQKIVCANLIVGGFFRPHTAG